uniref:Unkown protein n=1 Tax=Riptortus pedestris TaxID=329032 RepID=R4WS58_RIPPE|nr:unkown protein [Riptortus pedestris]
MYVLYIYIHTYMSIVKIFNCSFLTKCWPMLVFCKKVYYCYKLYRFNVDHITKYFCKYVIKSSKHFIF